MNATTQTRINIRIMVAEIVRDILLQLGGEGHDPGAVNNAVDTVLADIIKNEM